MLQILWEIQIVNLNKKIIDVNQNNQSIRIGMDSVINKYSTFNAFAKHINICINKNTATSILHDFILMHKNKLIYFNKSINDGGIDLILFIISLNTFRF